MIFHVSFLTYWVWLLPSSSVSLPTLQVGAHRCHHRSSSRTPAANTGAGHCAGRTGASSASGRIHVAWMHAAGDLTLFWHHCWLFIFFISICTHMRTHKHKQTHTHMHVYVYINIFICVLIFKILISDSWYSHTRTYPEIIAIHICPLATNPAMDIFFQFVGDFPVPFSLATGYQGTHGALCKTIQNPKSLKEVCRRLHLVYWFFCLFACLSIFVSDSFRWRDWYWSIDYWWAG